jgi:hypothetical protein
MQLIQPPRPRSEAHRQAAPAYKVPRSKATEPFAKALPGAIDGPDHDAAKSEHRRLRRDVLLQALEIDPN